MPTATCHVKRQAPRPAPGKLPGPPTHLGIIQVTLPLGLSESSDVALATAKKAAAAYGKAPESSVICNHKVGGGFVATLPPEAGR